jgi:hypothetical protein
MLFAGLIVATTACANDHIDPEDDQPERSDNELA